MGLPSKIIILARQSSPRLDKDEHTEITAQTSISSFDEDNSLEYSTATKDGGRLRGTNDYYRRVSPSGLKFARHSVYTRGSRNRDEPRSSRSSNIAERNRRLDDPAYKARRDRRVEALRSQRRGQRPHVGNIVSVVADSTTQQQQSIDMTLPLDKPEAKNVNAIDSDAPLPQNEVGSSGTGDMDAFAQEQGDPKLTNTDAQVEKLSSTQERSKCPEDEQLLRSLREQIVHLEKNLKNLDLKWQGRLRRRTNEYQRKVKKSRDETQFWKEKCLSLQGRKGQLGDLKQMAHQCRRNAAEAQKEFAKYREETRELIAELFPTRVPSHHKEKQQKLVPKNSGQATPEAPLQEDEEGSTSSSDGGSSTSPDFSPSMGNSSSLRLQVSKPWRRPM